MDLIIVLQYNMHHEEPSRNQSKSPPQPNDTNQTPYTTDENDAIALLLAIASGIESSNSTRKIRTTSPLAQGKRNIAKGHRASTGHYNTHVQTNLHELSAFINNDDSSSNYSEKTVEVHNDHHTLQYYRKVFPKPVHDREWHTSVITKVVDENIIIKVAVPCYRREAETAPP